MSTSHAPPAPLVLTPSEKLLRSCLAECAAQVDPQLEIRFAGGWVRDKLLKHASNDIDCALSILSGKDFGQHLFNFYKKHGEKFKAEAKQLGIGENAAELNKIVLVDEDAEKSKHLAVAKMKLFGLEVDLVNLRTEVYAEHSRTPVIQMGTAREDALRRDATINALFYNIHTETVEDFTGKGLEDLRNGIMRTPMDPEQTFRDDPLRVLRLIRFASRLDFEIEDGAMQAMKSPVIHQALKLKISRERVRIEIVKALEGPRPAKALLYIHQLGLFAACFAHPEDPNPPAHKTLPQTCENLTTILSNDILTTGLQLREPESKSLPWLLAVYIPWCTSSLPPASGISAIKEAMKATVRESKLLEASLLHRTEISALVSSISQSQAQSSAASSTTPTTTITNIPAPSRGKIGMFLRRLGPTWGHEFLFALLCDMQTSPTPEHPPRPSIMIDRYVTFLHHLAALSLAGTAAIGAKSLLGGRQIIEILAKGKTGPGNKMAADLVMEWGFENPEGTVEGCAEMLRGERERILAWEREEEEKRGKKRKVDRAS